MSTTTGEPGEARSFRDSEERVDDDPYSLAWQWLDHARATQDPEALDAAEDQLRWAISQLNPLDMARPVARDYRRYFGALNTYAYMPVWRALVAGQQVDANIMDETRQELGKILQYYPSPSSPDHPSGQLGCVINTLALALLTSADNGSIAMPDAPYRQRQNLDGFIIVRDDESYTRVSTRRRDSVQMTLDPAQLIEDSFRGVTLPRPRQAEAGATGEDDSSRRLQLMDEMRDALIAQANNESPYPRALQAIINSKSVAARMLSRRR